MNNLEQARINMVESQVRTNDVTDQRLLAALLEIPRERFVPSSLRPIAYVDDDLCIKPASDGGAARYLMEATPFARLVALAGVGPDDLVLDVGCGTGYSSAVLSRLCNSVVALEEDDDLARQANEILPELEIGNVAVVSGPLTAGYPSEGPYDVIFMNGCVDEVPQPLLDQLKDGGRLVAVVAGRGLGKACLFGRSGSQFSHRAAFDVTVRPLPGFGRPQAFVF